MYRHLLSGLIIALGIATVPSLAHADLIHYWNLNGNANDSGTVGGQNGTINGDVGFAAGQFGQAGTFDGNGDRIVTGANPLPATNYTLSAWISTDSVSTFSYVAGTQNSNDGGSFLRVEPDLALLGNVLPAMNTIEAAVSGSNAVPLSDWTQVSLTVSTTEGSKLYLNGSEVAANAAGTSQLAVSNFTIGSRPDSTQTLFFDGLIDDVAVFDGPLSADEMTGFFDVGNELLYDAGTFELLMSIHDAGTGTLEVGGLIWSFADGLTDPPGLTADGANFNLVLDSVAGTGLIGAAVPEPNVIGIWSLMALGLIGFRHFRNRRSNR